MKSSNCRLVMVFFSRDIEAARLIMKIKLPEIIQGGMGAGVSNWRLARAVSELGQLGVVSGTALDQILLRRLQVGDPGGHMRRGLAAFPFRRLAEQIVETFYIPNGKSPDQPFRSVPMHAIEGSEWQNGLCTAANFVEVFLAREGHGNPVGINYLEKIQLPHLPSIYGAMLAGVDVVIVGAGIPFEIPAVLDSLTEHGQASYTVQVNGSSSDEQTRLTFDPASLQDEGDELPELSRPDFLPIVSSQTLATVLKRRVGSGLSGFVVEGSPAGGHNAPPRGRPRYADSGELIYGPRDQIDLSAIGKLGLPFWLAGSYGSPEGLRSARSAGAAGVQVGTAFALCRESGLDPSVRLDLVAKALRGEVKVFTDPVASPTGFPFKVAQLEGSLSEQTVYDRRRRICDLGYLREPYRRDDGSIGYRCPAEPETVYQAKSGDPEATEGRKCLCNALVANIGLGQRRPDGADEPGLLTLGDDVAEIGRFCNLDSPDYSAADVIRVLTA